MADHSVDAWNEVHESEASQASVFCFDNAFLQKSCLFVDLVCFISLCLRVAVFLNATRSDRSVHWLMHLVPGTDRVVRHICIRCIGMLFIFYCETQKTVNT